MLGRRSPKLAEVIENPVEAIATGQIRVDRIVPKSGIQAGAQRRGSMVKVEDNQLIEEWLKSFPATQIQEELGRHKKGLTQAALSKWAEDQGVDIRGHLEKELVTMALKGMSPTNYVQLDLIVVVADGELRQVLKPRKLPWEN